MINDMDNPICGKCGGTLERMSLISHTSSAKEYFCKCHACGDETIFSYESTCADEVTEQE